MWVSYVNGTPKHSKWDTKMSQIGPLIYGITHISLFRELSTKEITSIYSKSGLHPREGFALRKLNINSKILKRSRNVAW